jgi:hypothetical protein
MNILLGLVKYKIMDKKLIQDDNEMSDAGERIDSVLTELMNLSTRAVGLIVNSQSTCLKTVREVEGLIIEVGVHRKVHTYVITPTSSSQDSFHMGISFGALSTPNSQSVNPFPSNDSFLYFSLGSSNSDCAGFGLLGENDSAIITLFEDVA